MRDKPNTFIVDSFSHEAFKGNPAGVCLLEEMLEPDRMQKIAAELNLSETAFVLVDSADSLESFQTHGIRYFSPKMEIPLCGHATLAAAKVLFDTEGLTKVSFRTFDGVELCSRQVEDRIEMEFPIYELQPASVPKALLDALGVSRVEYSGYNAETKILMLEISTAAELAELQPDFNSLVASHDSINGVLVTARANDEFDFHSRYFWPWSGTNEDPATGGTHTFLAKYWSEKLGKRRMHSFQASKRTGNLEVEIDAAGKLLIRAGAVIVLEGRLKA